MTSPSPHSDHRKRFETAALIATSAVSAAAILIIEILAGRILAPYVGMSVYTWTAIISTVLAGLAIGNWLGGHMTSNSTDTDRRRLGIMLMVAALTTAAILFLAKPLAGFVLGLTDNTIIAVTGLSFGLFFIPALLGGMPSPILASYIVRLHREAEGRALSWIFASGSAGAILGSAASGFLLIPLFGSAYSTLTASALLAVMGALWLVGSKSKFALFGSFLVFSATIWSGVVSWKSVCDTETATFCIRVVSVMGGDVERSNIRGLVLDHLVHGVNMKDRPDVLLSPYIAQIDHATRVLQPDASSAFFIGGGAYTLPRLWSAKMSVTVSEIEPAVTEMAEQRLWVNTQDMTIKHLDARVALTKAEDQTYDLVIGDAFKDVAAPFHLTTRQFAELVKEKLNRNGIYFMNVVDREPDPRAVLAITATLRSVFPHLAIWRDEIDGPGSQRHTYVIAASVSPFQHDPGVPAAIQGWKPFTFPEQPLMQAQILTDNHAPIEYLLDLMSDTLD